MEQKPIPQAAKRLLEQIASLDEIQNFYLAGGTALAIQLNHRQSIDLDWFSAKSFSNKKITSSLSKLGDFRINQQEEGTIHGTLNGVKITFLSYKYPLLFPLVNYKAASLANERDIAAMKLDAVSSRGSKKDFIDIYFLLQKYSLNELLSIFQKKFSEIEYNKIHLLKSLAYFDDAENEPMPKMIKKIDWEKIKKFITKKSVEQFEKSKI